MKYCLQVSFIMDDTNDDQNELIEEIRNEVSDTISNYSDTWKPNIKIWEEIEMSKTWPK